jgi:S-adenosylmethionine hydrolase
VNPEATTSSARRRLTLLTDFGTADGYVAAMRGVIASRCPDAPVDDASHDIPPGDVQAAAHALSRYWKLYPIGTIHVVVVDPGVGGTRHAIAVLADGRIGIGPDNGVLEPMLAMGEEVRIISNAALTAGEPSATFHGRDVFAPVAAHIACGGTMNEVGDALEEPVRLVCASPVRQQDRLVGRVVHVDRFGNLITNLSSADGPGTEVWLGERRIGALRRTYGDVPSGELLALIGSTGFVEISVRDGSAARSLGLGRGTPVELRSA